MAKNRVYLAGPITGLSYLDSEDWRFMIQDHATISGVPNIEWLSPLRGKSHLDDGNPIPDNIANSLHSSPRAITTRDRLDVETSGAVVFNFLGASKASIGSCIELGWSDAWRKPIIVIMEESDIHYHAMVRDIAGWIVPSHREAVEVLQHLFGDAQ